MNVHDSEKVANLLLHAGWRRARERGRRGSARSINTCSIREKAEHRLYSDLGAAARVEGASAPGRMLGVGGCVAQQEGDALLRRFAHLDFVFGTHNLRLVPALADAAARGRARARAPRRRARSSASTCPQRHPAFAGRDARPAPSSR